jgi:enoyl-CoA hydratase/3-hydroxyacyl-CoA dehydrogenase
VGKQLKILWITLKNRRLNDNSGGYNMNIKHILVIGAGTMGSGVTQCAAQSGYKVTMMDTTQDFVQRGMDKINRTLEKGIAKGKVSQEKADRVRSNISTTTDYTEAAKDADVVIEAVFEEMSIKEEIFKNLDRLCKPEAILTSNTSSLSITDLGELTSRPERVAGLHFFNPAAINKLIEVVAGEKTLPDIVDTLLNVSVRMGKIPLNVKDAPGFAVNRYFVPFLNEACRIYQDEIANIPTIDQAAMEGFKIGMGPFKLMNFTGIPIAFHAESSLAKELGDAYKPVDMLKNQFEGKAEWNLEGEVQSDKLDIVKKRLWGCTWGIAAELVNQGVASPEDVDRGAMIGLRWEAGPFAMMNNIGTKEALVILEQYSQSTNGVWQVPDNIKQLGSENKPWPIRYVKWAKDNHLGIIYMNRPEALNALNSKVLNDLETAIEELGRDDEVRALIITGYGNAFVAGADIKEMMGQTLEESREYTKYGQEVFSKIENLNKPVIAAVNGYALGGGCELALACDIIVASKMAKFGLPEVNLGIHPGFGGTQRLPRLVGRARAKELIFTGNQISANEAYEIGLANKVVDPEQLMDETKQIAKTIASKGPIAVSQAKQAINKGLEVELVEGLNMELDSIAIAFNTEDKKEGMEAFVQRRKPDFKGK